MRMWMINPRWLCQKHLGGEHGEIHKHMPDLRNGKSVSGRFTPVVQIQLNAIESRHNELAAEIDRRAKLRGSGGHKSPLADVPDLQSIYPEHYHLKVDVEESLSELVRRCPECADLIGGPCES